jgi:hypothetical protein
MALVKEIDGQRKSEREDWRKAIERLEEKMTTWEKDWDAKMAKNNKKWEEILAANDKQREEKFAANDKKWDEIFAANDKKWDEIFAANDKKWEASMKKMEADNTELKHEIEVLKQTCSALRADNATLTNNFDAYVKLQTKLHAEIRMVRLYAVPPMTGH